MRPRVIPSLSSFTTFRFYDIRVTPRLSSVKHRSSPACFQESEVPAMDDLAAITFGTGCWVNTQPHPFRPASSILYVTWPETEVSRFGWECSWLLLPSDVREDQINPYDDTTILTCVFHGCDTLWYNIKNWPVYMIFVSLLQCCNVRVHHYFGVP